MQTSASRAKYAYTHPSRSSTLRAMTFFPRTRPTLGPARFSRQKMKSAVSAFLPFFSWVVHTREEMRGAALACCAGVVAFVGLVVVASVRPFAISVPTLWTTAMLRSSNDSAGGRLRRMSRSDATVRTTTGVRTSGEAPSVGRPRCSARNAPSERFISLLTTS